MTIKYAWKVFEKRTCTNLFAVFDILKIKILLDRVTVKRIDCLNFILIDC